MTKELLLINIIQEKYYEDFFLLLKILKIQKHFNF